MNELSVVESPVVTARSFALIIPVVTVPDNPRGEPIAITASPTSIVSLLPNCKALNPTASIFKTAKSKDASRPITFAVYVVPSLSDTLIFPPFRTASLIT